MKAIAVVPGSSVQPVDRPEPQISAPDQVKMRVLRVGVCGTDREQIAGGHAHIPPGQSDMVIGHEVLGQVVEVGAAVTRVRVGDHAVFTVRRGCGQCLPCAMNRPDMCHTGKYVERGIRLGDGFQSEFVVDAEQFAILVPPSLVSLGILCEPLSVVEKSLDTVARIQQSRVPDAAATPDWFHGRRCLIAGLGPIDRKSVV